MTMAYKILHIEHMSQRSKPVKRNSMLLKMSGAEELQCSVQDLSTFEKMNNFINSNEGFSVRYHNEFGNPFPHVSGVIGVWASNWVAWKEFLTTDAETLMILEDDVVLEIDAVETINKIINFLPDDWDIFSFFIPDGAENFYSEYKHGVNNKIVCKAYQGWSCGGYIMSRGGAEKIISYLNDNPIDLPIDWFMFDVSPDHINVYNPVPSLKRIAVFDEDYVNSYIGETEGIVK